jgi:LysM repeat protein
MKSIGWIFLFGIVLSLCGSDVVGATTADRAAASAERAAAEERYRRMNSAIEGLLAAQADLQRRMALLGDEINSLRAESSRSGGQYVSREEFDKLVEAVRELDQKRAEDKRQILAELADLGTELKSQIRRSLSEIDTANSARFQAAQSGSGGSDSEGVWYTVEPGNTLSAIATAYNQAYNSKGRKTSVDLIMKANPKVKPEVLGVGQKVWVPLVPN